MLAYILRSLAQGLVVLVAVSFIAFSMFRFVGDPIANMVGQEASQADRAELPRRLGLDQPFPVQFLQFLGNAARGDFGISYRQGRPVSALIAERLPATVELAVLSALFATIIGIGLIYVFAVELRWLPSFGRGETVRLGWWATGLLTPSGLQSLILPVLTLGFFQLTLIMRLVRSEMLEVMRSDFIRFARARGIPNRVIEFRHA